jgi:hypothetical protein
VNRGGSFNNDASNARSANRNNNTPENRNNNLGVRPANVSQRQIAADHGPPRRARDTQTCLRGRHPAGRTGISIAGGRRRALVEPSGEALNNPRRSRAPHLSRIPPLELAARGRTSLFFE